MDTVHIEPINPRRFIEKFFIVDDGQENKYYEFFRASIESLPKFAIGPFYWFIPENHSGKILAISDNCKELTPYSQEQWLNLENPNEQAPNIMHPEDMHFIYASIGYAIGMAQDLYHKQHKINVSIYARFMAADRSFRWMLMQIPDFYFDEALNCHSLLIVMTDLSHLPPPAEIMMTVMVSTPEQNQYFKVFPLQQQTKVLPKINITRREAEVLRLMVRGLRTPDIVTELGVAYDTVENHKRNLRAKTNTKTAAELIAFVMANHLI
ncbi:LuxR C-terminal-related transcriptional regulator [Emticicia sp. 17c]|uniref:LuxR C-terminal-related transcriptional regulator n=1 Tax=Emticicia sp. 17c TaxID=3127704 RepID=UPI00301D93AC